MLLAPQRPTMPLRTSISVLALCTALSCAREPQPVTRAFYFWRTHAALSAPERDALSVQHVQRLYLRLFDVAVDGAGAPKPVGQVRFADAFPQGLEIVPVVYLTNAALKATADPAALADQVWTLASSLAAEGKFTFSELQVDCDWTDSTRAAYFAFCARLRDRARPGRLSATIRLHQIKYPARTGVPPVDRGMLMFYNMGKLASDATRPSIFNSDDASRYTAWIDRYPLPLDAGLPVFSWLVHVRGGRIVGLIEKPDLVELAQTPGLQRQAPDRYVAERGLLFRGGYLQEGDTLTLEAMTPARAQQAADLLAQHFHPRGPFSIALFDLDARNLHGYSQVDLNNLFNAVH
jgi:hypothetical protein